MPQGRPKTGGWSQSGKLIIGGGAFIPPLPPLGPGVPTVLASSLLGRGLKFQADFTMDCYDGERPAEQYTVQFGITPPAKYQFIHPNVTAEIQFSVSGNTVIRRISLGDGTSISGICEALSVKVIDQTVDIPIDPDTGLPDFNVEYIVSVNAAPLPRSDGYTPPIFRPLRDLQHGPYLVVPGGPVPVAVPTIAGGVKSLMVMVSHATGGTLAGAGVIFADQTATAIGTYNPQSPIWVPMLPTTHSLFFLNGNPPLSGTLIYTPIYGVDG